MRWDFVIEHWITRLQADASLVSLMNSSAFIYASGAAKPVKVPSIEYMIVGDREDELFNPIQVQVDFWQRGIKKAAQTERRIRLLTHSDVGQDLGGERLWMRYLESRTTEYPAEPGVVHKILDFLFEPVREKYVA